MAMVTIDAATLSPPGASAGHGLAETELGRMVSQLRSLSAEDWSRPTVCEQWDVRTMASHVLAMAEAQASMRQFAHDFRSPPEERAGR